VRAARLAPLALALLALAACGGGEAARAAAVSPSPTAVPTSPTTPAPPPSAPPSSQPAPALAPNAARPPVVTSGWMGPIYPPRAHGYDISYPQCSTVQGPAQAAFSIVGVNDGKAFTTNPCLAAQWRAARDPRAVYFNSGYEPDNASQTTAGCRARSQLQDGSDLRRTAYAIGCSEALYALAAMRTAGAGGAVMIWIDVESSNSWDVANQDLNRTTLQAEVDELAAFGRLVGLYGTFAEWRNVVGDWSPAGVVADWVAGQPADVTCRAPGFSGHPVWLAQEVAAWPDSGEDSDWAC